jgi:hypothetical protein
MSVAAPPRPAVVDPEPPVQTLAVDPHRRVQTPVRFGSPSRSRRLEGIAIFVIFGLGFGILGYWLIVSAHVVSFDSLTRLANAYLAWHNVPSKLAAIGFTQPPLQTLSLLPLALFTSLAKSLLALPICSAIFGGLTMTVLNRLLERCELVAPLRYLTLLLFALIPTVCFYAADGGAEMIALYLLAVSVSALVAWLITLDTRYLVVAGMVFGLAGLADYSAFAWMLLGAVMVTVVLYRHRARNAEVEGSLITYLTPSLYALIVWTVLSALIVGRPFGWLDGGHAAAVSTSTVTAVPVTLLHALHQTLTLAWSSAPLALVVIPALLVAAVVKRDELAAWVAAFSILALLTPATEALIYHDASQMQLDKGLPLLLMSVFGAAVLYRSFATLRPLVGIALIAGLAGSAVVVWHGMSTYPYQNLEQAFHRAVATGHSQEGTVSRGGIQVGINSELAMAQYINAHVRANKSVLTDNSQTYAVILLTGRPGVFQTRIDHGDAPWLRAVKRPPRSVRYMLIAQNASGDLIRQTYPQAAGGHSAGLTVVYSDPRYTLLSVAAGVTYKTQSTPSLSPSGPIDLSATAGAARSLQVTP